ncbi:MAG: Phosphoglucomutase-3 [Vezdaea aestivalis]|nr:MAG: Phosphoglucomutase-3 [Vezdaea aestivalis]
MDGSSDSVLSKAELHIVRSLAQKWLELDRDPSTREAIRGFLDTNDEQELKDRFLQKLKFGTAGLRARMGAGFALLNDITIAQAAQGLAVHLLSIRKETVDEKELLQPSLIVIGHDARHNSERFAALVASVFIFYEFRVYFFNMPVHTPMIPFSIRKFGADGGVMITASHNPGHDNGFKVYTANGHQIVSPEDETIAKRIDEQMKIHVLDTRLFDEENAKNKEKVFADDITGPQNVKNTRESMIIDLKGFDQDYARAILEALPQPKVPTTGVSRNMDYVPEFVYTPLHGVGQFPMDYVTTCAGIGKKMHRVDLQMEPDPDFPTVKFPNPEEDGALDLALEEADAEKINLVLANDPDADRLAVAEKVNGDWIQFSGNQVGMLLAAYIFETHRNLDRKLAIFTSTVSTGMVGIMAEKEGVYFEETLTGFKWMGSRAFQLEASGEPWTVFAFEEALGYMFGDVCFDKDGVAAALFFLSGASRWMEVEKLTPWAKLQQLYEKYGHFEDANTFVRCSDLESIDKTFSMIRSRSKGLDEPKSVAGIPVIYWRDLTRGYESSTEGNKPNLPVDATTQMITCELKNGVRFTIRASGTEPKIKYYIEGRGETAKEAKTAAMDICLFLLDKWTPNAVTNQKLS